MSMFFGKVLVVIVVAMIGYVSSQDTCEFAPNSRQMAAEMMTLLAGLNNKVTDLTETAKKQSSTNAKLKLKLKQANDTCKAQVSSMQEEIDALKEKEIAAQVKHNASVEELKNAVKDIRAEVSTQNAEMSSMKTDLNALKNAVNDIRAEGRDIVAFAVHNPPRGYLNRHDTVMFRTVDTNIGGHFDISRSTFTCPFTGLYLLHLSVMNVNSVVKLRIVINGDKVAYAIADGDGSNDYDQASDMTIHRCQAGGIVKVECNDPGRIYDGLHTTFSGVLLKRL